MYIFALRFQCKALPLVIFAALVVPGHAQLNPADPFKDEFLSLNNLTSPLPPGWTQFLCWDDCGFDRDPASELLFGPAFSDSVHMTIEACVEFCDAQGSRLAGLKGSGCGCANILNPEVCFESNIDSACMDPDQVGLGCPGNRQESCGLDSVLLGSSLVNLFWKQMFTQFSCLAPEWPGGAPLTAIGSWRFSYWYNDSAVIHALSQNAAELANPPPFDNLTTVACVTTCNNAGFTLAGLKAGNQCFCGSSIENGASPITDCFNLDPEGMTPCSGNNLEFCGSTDKIAIYTLPGTGLIPMIPFDSALDTFCSSRNCIGAA